MAHGQLFVVLIQCVAPVLSLYGWWVRTCGTYPELPHCYYHMAGRYLLGCLLHVWPHCYMYHCMTGWYLLVVLTHMAPLLPLYGRWVSSSGTYPVWGPSVTTVTPVCGGGPNQTADPVYNGHIQLTLQIGQIHTHLCPGSRPASLGPLQSKTSNVNHTPIATITRGPWATSLTWENSSNH